MNIRLDYVLNSGYCSDYDEDRIRRMWGARETVTAIDVLDSHLLVADRLCLVLSTPALTDEQLHTFRATLAHYGADIYERYHNDARVRDCADAWQRLAAGEVVYMNPFMDAASDAASDAAIAAAWAAAGAAARDAASDAAMAAAWDEITRWLRDIIEVCDAE